MQFQIPQFIETEDKIVGPFTLKQFLYFAGAGGISFVLYFTLNFFFWFMITFFLALVAVGLAFVKINGLPLIKILMAAVGFMMKPRLYVWQRRLEGKTVEVPEDEDEETPEKEKPAEDGHRPAISGSLSSLAEKLKTGSSYIPKREQPMPSRFSTYTAAPPAATAPAPKTDNPHQQAPQPIENPTTQPTPQQNNQYVELELPSGEIQKAKRVDYGE